LTELVKQAKEFTQKIIFVSLIKVDESKTTPIPLNPQKFYYNENMLKYNGEIKNICGAFNLQFIDLFDLLSNEDLDDGLHPNSEGHKKMFEAIKDFLLKNKVL
jgi:lysophospholipase L1-like esterase